MVGASIASALILLTLVGFYARIIAWNDNALQATGQYAAEHIPANAVVLTEQTIGNLIQQPFCDIRAHIAWCGDDARYIITYTSANYHGPKSARLQNLIRGSTEVWHDAGFKETITVYAVNRP